MSLPALLILGLLAGFTASKLVNRNGHGLEIDLVLGMMGAILGSRFLRHFDQASLAGFNFYSLLVVTLGATLLLLLYHAFVRLLR